MAQAHVYARAFFNDSDPSDETLAQATWLYSDVMKMISLSVQNGIANAFKGK